MNHSKTCTTGLSDDYHVAAYIWPSCHHDKRFGKFIWPGGKGEWEVINKGVRRFEGHYQPRLPLWGYELDNDPTVVERWINVALEHRINVFIYDWYWYEGGPFLESALIDGFLKAKNNHKMQFYIMWANHDMQWDLLNVTKFEKDSSFYWKGTVDLENFKIIVDRLIAQYFKLPNYFKIDGMPVFSIFSVDKLLESFNGDLVETQKALYYFREEVKKAGFPDLHIQYNQGGGFFMSDEEAKWFSGRVEEIGFNSVALYNMGGMDKDYLVYGTNSIKIREQMDSILDIPFFPCVSIGWDNTPRFPDKEKEGIVHYHNTPESFAALLSKAKNMSMSIPNNLN